MSQKIKKAKFVTVYKDKVYKIVGENTIELPDGRRIVLDPEAPPKKGGRL